MLGTERYKAVSASSASNQDLVVMAFEGALRYQRKAQEAFEEKNNTGARQHLARVRAIVGELLSAVDTESAPDLAANLTRLYTWMIVELSRAGMDKDVRRIGPVMRVTSNLLDGFLRAFRQPA